MASATLPPAATESTRLPLTAGQWGWLSIQAAGLLAVIGWQAAAQPDTFPLLWKDPVGVRMTSVACVVLAVHFMAQMAGYAVINRYTRREPGKPGVTSLALAALVSVGCLLLLYLPVVFVILLGPAAIRIQNTMLGS